MHNIIDIGIDRRSISYRLRQGGFDIRGKEGLYGLWLNSVIPDDDRSMIQFIPIIDIKFSSHVLCKVML